MHKLVGFEIAWGGEGLGTEAAFVRLILKVEIVEDTTKSFPKRWWRIPLKDDPAFVNYLVWGFALLEWGSTLFSVSPCCGSSCGSRGCWML